MFYLFVAVVSFFASGLTLFSGFGLGTILMPVFAVFFPLDVAIAMSAIVHLLNNIFKLFLLGQDADYNVVVRFGFTAILAALAGAQLLFWLEGWPPLYRYHIFNYGFSITLVKLVISALMIIFVFLELSPRFQNW